jgi:hypothetical protein
MTYTPDTEGIDHINAYSKSTLELGRLLSNFARQEISVGQDGRFASIEAYWYWLVCHKHPDKDQLRNLSGFAAKKKGREFASGDWRDDDPFKAKIQKACWIKILFNERLRELLRESTLPIVHYYVYGYSGQGNPEMPGVPPRVITPEHGQWLWEWYEKARDFLKLNPEL